MLKQKIILLIIFTCIGILFSQKQESILDKKDIATSYSEAGLYDDAIHIYLDILDIQRNILGPYHPALIKTLFELSDLYLNVNDVESSENYLKHALEIQYNLFLKKQTDYIDTYKKIKNLYTVINDTIKVTTIDSVLNILYNMSSDTLLVPEEKKEYPDLIYFKPIILDSTNLVSIYSNNDKALDLFDNANNYLKTNLYSEAITAFDSALKLNAPIIDEEYLLNIDFGDSIVVNELYNILNEVSLYDSTITKHNLLLGILDIKSSKNFKNIKEHLELYIIDYPNDYLGHLLLGQSYYNEGDYFSAMSYLFNTEMINKGNINAKQLFGMSLFHMEEYLDAIYKFNEVITLNEQSYDAKYYTGLAYLLLDKYQDAVQYFSQALLLDSSQDNIYYNIGVAYKELGKKRQALEAFKQAIAINNSNGYAHFELGKIYELILEVELAINHYKIANKHIEHDELSFHYGTILYKNQMYKEAMTPLRQYIINNPYNTDILILLGDIFIKEKRFPEAIDTYLRLLDDFPHNEQYYYLIAESYFELGNYSNAKEYYLQVLTFNEENPEILLKLGNLTNKLYQFDQSEVFLKEAIACGTTSKDLLFELGISYGGQSKYLQAMKVFQEALSYSLDDPVLHYQLGVVYQAMNLYELSIDEYKKYLFYNPDDQIINYMIGESYFGLNDFKKAIEYFKMVLDKYGYSEVKSLYQTGMCYVELEDYHNAAKYLKLVLKTNPDHSLSRYNLVDIYLSLNKAKEAKKECDILFMLNRDLYHSSDYCTNY